MNNRQEFFTTLNTFFNHVYVITLQRATDRHEHIKKELDGLNYELFFGKDKQAFTIEDVSETGVYDEALAKQHHRYGKPMQSGQIGCAWSHAEVYRDVLQKGYEKVLILEDDVIIDEAASKIFTVVVAELPVNWQLLYFGFAEREKAPANFFLKQGFYHLLRVFKAIKYSHSTINHLYPKKRTAHIYEAGYHDCTHAYGLTKAAAEKLLELQQPISFVADNLLAHTVTNKIVNGYIILPKLIHQQYQVGTSSASYLNE